MDQETVRTICYLARLQIDEDKAQKIELPERYEIPEKPKWSTLFIAAGKKDKINKIDIVGFLSKQGKLGKDELGLIIVQDRISFAAVKRDKHKDVLKHIRNEKIKGKKLKIEVAM